MLTPISPLKTVSTEETVAKLFEPDVLAAYDYFDSLQRKEPFEPEKQLMEAALEDAISIYRLYALAKSTRQRHLFLEAQRWIWADDWNWPFSFQNICAVLGLDPGYLRSGLRRWKENQAEELAENAPLSEKNQFAATAT